MSLVYGLLFVLAELRPEAGSKIVARSDCQGAIAALTGKLGRRKTVARLAPVVAVYRTRIVATGIAVEFRYTPAHKGTASPAYTMNTWCDTECRKQMRLARKATLSGADPQRPSLP